MGEQRAACFFNPIKKLILATFPNMKKVKACKVNFKIVPLQKTKDLFTEISLISQKRSLDLRSDSPLDSLHGEQVLIIDGMTYVQESKVYNKTRSVCYGLVEQKTCSWKKKPVVSMLFLTITPMYQSKM